ncbi:MAG TPA: endonuclease/exonuclease/phosphatase family protein [Aeromicrobium sp.]|nr:endonuclease/exonuclease/phosphatase family protein [Aeromicrobium sp.]
MSPSDKAGRGWLLGVVTYGLIAIGVAGFLARHWRAHHTVALAIIAFSPYLMLAAAAALVIALLRRRRIAAFLAAVVTAAGVGTQVPHFLSDDVPGNAVKVRVMTFNLRLGEADAAEVVREVRKNRIELLMVEELSMTGLAKLVAAGIDKELPYNQGKPGLLGPDGTGLWSRYPIQSGHMVKGLSFATPAALVDVPGVTQPVYAVAMHPIGPRKASRYWARDIASVPFILRAVPPGAVIVGGDFNATPDNVWFRAVLETPGYANAIDQAGSGPIRTYNAEHPLPLIAIDHVLTRGAVATDVRSVHISGSDHRAIIATVAIPRTAPDADR